jgi:penicillin amidase
MLRRFVWIPLSLLVSVIALLGSGDGRAAPEGYTTLNVDGEDARIFRDEFGRPHIFADSNRGLFEAYGYTVAEDRLWQLELNRRAARGKLAEILGSGVLASDRSVRTVGYTDAELDAQFALLNAEEQEIFSAYADGINRYVSEVVAADPQNKLPFEFHALGIGVPAPWTLRDSVAFGAFAVRRFGEIGGRELTNQSLLASLQAAHGSAAGLDIFDDVRWVNDPDAPVTVPTSGAIGKRQKATPAQLEGASEGWPDPLDAEAREIWQELGIPTKLGSYAWAISEARSAEGFAMLYGGPQTGFSAPELMHEVQLNGGNGFKVTGMAFAGVAPVLIGRTDHIAWTSTTATGDNLDTYIETLCDAGGGPGTGYMFNSVCTPFEVRVETINVRGGAPVSHTVVRSVHGPVVGSGSGVVFSQKRAHWQREIESARPFLAFNRARNMTEFEAAVEQVVTSHNFLYADKSGNIAYWQAGQVPLRPEGFDPRLPLPGDGSAEWPGGIRPIPKSINPVQGFLSNWNNKPSVEYDNADDQIFGKQFRLLDIDDRLATGQISLEDMRDIPKDIARVGGLGREARFLKPYLLAALDAVPPGHPLAAQARAVLEAWDGSSFADAITSTTLEPGQVIFSTWITRMRNNTFTDELGTRVSEANANTLIHVLDDALGGGSGVPPSRDYFNAVDPNAAMSAAFDQTLTSLGPNPAVWSSQPRGVINFNHPVVGNVGSIPNSNRATYAQIVVLSRPQVSGESIFSLGQSGFIKLVPPSGFALDPHFRDQLELFRNFQYKSMPLFRGTPNEDTDLDTFSDAIEISAGTDPGRACAVTASPNDEVVDAWPADINDDGFSDISDISALGASFGRPVPPAPVRYDIAPEPPDGFVDITDIARMGSLFGRSCGP